MQLAVSIQGRRKSKEKKRRKKKRKKEKKIFRSPFNVIRQTQVRKEFSCGIRSGKKQLENHNC